MSEQHNAAFNELIYASASEFARVSNTEQPFISQFKDTTAEPIVDVVERDNDIYNLGVMDGAVQILDNLRVAGYTLSDPEGNLVVPSEGGSFTSDYFSRKYWESVSN